MTDSPHTACDRPQYIKTPDLLRLLRIGRKRLAEAIEAGQLPPPVSLGPRCRMWDRNQVEAWFTASQPAPNLNPPEN